MASSGGFSLLEVLVSLAIFSFAGLTGLALIDSMSRTHARLDERFARLEALHVFMADFTHDVTTSDRDALRVGEDGLILGTQACERRTQYTVQSGSLVRDVAGCDQSRLLIDGVAEARFTVIDADLDSQVTWSAASNKIGYPRAVRLDLILDGASGRFSVHKLVDIPGEPEP